MKHTLVLILLAVLSWYAPEAWTTGEPIPWDAAADMVYLPCYSPDPSGPWTNLAQTELLWADAPDPPAGATWHYSCRAVYCPNFICGEPSGYAPPVSLTVPPTEPPPPTTKVRGKSGKTK